MRSDPRPMMSTRRRLLGAAALAGLATPWRLRAAPADSPRLLVVFLRGACDMASLLVPAASDDYLTARPRIAIARPGGGLEAALTLPGEVDWALAPALGDSLLPFYARGELAFVPFTGIHDLSRSHFETQDRLEMGAADGSPAEVRRSGWMNRLAAEIGAGRGEVIALTRELPLILRGDIAVPNQALDGASLAGIDARQAARLRQMYAGTALAGAVDDGLEVRRMAQQDLAPGMEPAGRGAISARGFEGEARRIARLMRERWRLGFVDIGGWDTHVGQGGATGALATRAGELGRGLAGFAAELGEAAWRDTVVVVMSEFGRTFRENGSRGTDHGHGTTWMVLGGAVRGGRIAGEQVPVGFATLHQGRDWPVLNDYRVLLAGLLGRMYGLDAARLARVFDARVAGASGPGGGLV